MLQWFQKAEAWPPGVHQAGRPYSRRIRSIGDAALEPAAFILHVTEARELTGNTFLGEEEILSSLPT
jgi:hypothetical protein